MAEDAKVSPSTRENIAVVLPIPRPRVRTRMNANPGVFRSWRYAKRRSCADANMLAPPRSTRKPYAAMFDLQSWVFLTKMNGGQTGMGCGSFAVPSFHPAPRLTHLFLRL